MNPQSSSSKDLLNDHTKMSEGGLTPRGILNGTAFKSGSSKHSHPFYEAASSRGGFGFTSTPSSPRISSPRMYGAFQMNSESSQDTIKLNSKSMSYFPSFPETAISPKQMSELKSSMQRIAQSDSSISTNPLTKQSNNNSRKSTTIHVTRPESLKPPATAPSRFRCSSNSDRPKPSTPAKSWKNELTLSNFTVMNPNLNNLDSLSLEELEKKITEKASQFTFNNEQTPYGDITKQLSRYIGKPSFGGNSNASTRKTSPASKSNSRTSASKSNSRTSASKSNSRTSASKHINDSGETSKALNKELIPHGSSFNIDQRAETPRLTELVQTEIARRMLRMLHGIGIGQDRPATPNTARNETLERLKKTYAILQEELNDLNINEEAFLEAKGLGANYFKPAKVHQKDLKMLENGNNSTARVRTASSRKAIKGNPSPMHEICESLKGPRVPKVKESPKSARTSEDDLKTNSNKSNLSLKRPATTQSVRVSPFLSENFKLQDEMSRKKSNAQWFQEHRSKLANPKTSSKPVKCSTSVGTPKNQIPKVQ